MGEIDLRNEPVTSPWPELLASAIRCMFDSVEFAGAIAEEHVRDTPQRVVDSYKEYFSGLKQDPEETLRKGFEPGTYDEMVFVSNINFVSFCAHHIVPFLGKVHFAYIPSRQIVGLSKIPRLVEIYSRRPQVQEKLTGEIADTFNRVVKPKGCGVIIEAVHLCMTIRGVKSQNATTRTTALRGIFLDDVVRHEFLEGVRK